MDKNNILPGLVQPLLDLLEDGVVVHDEYRKIYLINRATEILTGKKRSEIIGMDCYKAFPPDGLCGSSCAFKDGPSGIEERLHRVVKFIREDGEERQIKVTSDPIMIAGEKRGVLAIVRDVTELNHLRWRVNKKHSFHGMIGVSKPLQEVFETIRSVSASDYPVLISGESGTGKELAAGAIHRESRREGGPFVPVNCAALPENILESELFGHVRGAFTGAIRDKKGRFELAHRGTLFLDEVGELPLQMQVKLLRVLQEKAFERVGDEKSLTVDVRIIAASNRNLRLMVQDGEFREDLYYRLCVVPIDLPPLRQRREDIPHLVEKILADIKNETSKQITHVSDEAMGLLFTYPWPGNIRELINALQYASIRCKGEVIEESHLPYEVRFGPTPEVINQLDQKTNSYPPPGATSRPMSYPPLGQGSYDGVRPRTKLSAESVRQALEQTGGNKVKAAKLLGVGRATLYRFLSSSST